MWTLYKLDSSELYSSVQPRLIMHSHLHCFHAHLTCSMVPKMSVECHLSVGSQRKGLARDNLWERRHPLGKQHDCLFGVEPGEVDEQLCSSGSEDENAVEEGGSRVFEMGWQALHKFDSATMWSKMQKQLPAQKKRPYDNRKREQMAKGKQRSDAFRKNGMDTGRIQILLNSRACECNLFRIASPGICDT